ncbi:hypothetical protein FB451DRAFT_1262138 [Mycena latifolia]|nr:hypothetical protein FB451DRAFT_1262138 [Mycena latifolia]
MILLLVISRRFLSPPPSFPLCPHSTPGRSEYQPAMQRSFIVLLCLGIVRATLQNYTVDDTSPDIVYSQPEATFHCNTTSCPSEITEGRFNESATLTFGNITFSFTGTAFYSSLDLIGTCSINVDGNEIQTLSAGLFEGGEQLNISKADLANGPHTLVIAPTTDSTIIGFDHLVYTYVKLFVEHYVDFGNPTSANLPDKKSHVGAIVGGVIGGVVLTIGVLFAALFARRHKLIMRRNQRKSAVLRGISARPDYKVGADHGTDLPT